MENEVNELSTSIDPAQIQKMALVGFIDSGMYDTQLTMMMTGLTITREGYTGSKGRGGEHREAVPCVGEGEGRTRRWRTIINTSTYLILFAHRCQATYILILPCTIRYSLFWRWSTHMVNYCHAAYCFSCIVYGKAFSFCDLVPSSDIVVMPSLSRYVFVFVSYKS